MPASFSFGSVSGATFAFWFFSALSLLIAVTCGALARPLSRQHSWLAGRGSGGWQSILLGVVVFVAILGSIYLTMIDGFYHMTVETDRVLLRYILPERTLVLAKDDLSEVRTEPGPKNRWQLHVYSRTGTRQSSAQASYQEVREAQKFLEQYRAAPAER